METTLTVANGVSDIVFTHKRTDDNSVVWTAPSPQGDFDGLLRLDRKAVKTKGGILTRTFVFTTPVYNADAAKYTGFIQGRVSLSAPSTVPTTEVAKVAAMIVGVLDVTDNPDFAGELVAGSDAL
jgi:hypothetical protein